MPAELVDVPDVEILQVGEEWPASTGPITITEEDLQRIVDADGDPLVRAPVLKIGHSDKRFNAGDGQPSIGTVRDLRIDPVRKSIRATLKGVPAWIAEIMTSAWPSRSVELEGNQSNGGGKTHDLVLTGLALLGAQLPAIQSLEDVKTLYAMAKGHSFLVNMGRAELSGTQVEDVRRAYYEHVDGGPMDWWWIREMYVDPQELIVSSEDDQLYRVTYSVNGDQVSFGEPKAVRVEYVEDNAADVAASRRSPVLAYASKADATATPIRPVRASKGDIMDVPKEALIKALGLKTDATDAEITAAVESKGTLAPVSAPADVVVPGSVVEKTVGSDVVDSKPVGESGTVDGGQGLPQGEALKAAMAAAGLVAVDQKLFQELTEGAQLGRVARQEQVDLSRKAYLDGHQALGRFTRSEREVFEQMLAAGGDEADRAKKLIETKPANSVPVTELGRAESAHELAGGAGVAGPVYDPSWLSPAERDRIAASRGGNQAATGSVDGTQGGF